MQKIIYRGSLLGMMAGGGLGCYSLIFNGASNLFWFAVLFFVSLVVGHFAYQSGNEEDLKRLRPPKSWFDIAIVASAMIATAAIAMLAVVVPILGSGTSEFLLDVAADIGGGKFEWVFLGAVFTLMLAPFASPSLAKICLKHLPAQRLTETRRLFYKGLAQVAAGVLCNSVAIAAIGMNSILVERGQEIGRMLAAWAAVLITAYVLYLARLVFWSAPRMGVRRAS